MTRNLSGRLDSATYAALLRQKIESGSLQQGREIHQQLGLIGLDGETFLGNLLVQLYGQCGCPADARGAFEKIRRRNVFSWNILLAAHAKNGLFAEARELLGKMPWHSSAAWNALLSGYARKGHMLEARAMVDSMPEVSVISCNMIITAYAQNGDVKQAKEMFDAQPERDVVSWNAMLSAYAANGYNAEAIALFRLMNLEGEEEPDGVTFVTVLDACTSLGAVSVAKDIHSAATELLKLDLKVYCVVSTALVNMYGKCGRLEDAQRVFEEILEHDIVSWTAIITAYSQNGEAKRALELFRRMDLEGVQANRVTYVTVLDSCAELEVLTHGKAVHQEILSSGIAVDVIMGTALVKLYGKFGYVSEAAEIFHKLPKEDVVLWNAMISAYTINGFNNEALQLFRILNFSGVKLDKLTLVAASEACTTLKQGRLVHSTVKESGYLPDVVVGTALVNMYGRCGGLDAAEALFKNLRTRNSVTWNALLGAYAENGRGAAVLDMFREMEIQGLTCDKVTFVSLLFLSSHIGSLPDARSCFLSLQSDYGLAPNSDHYRIVADLLGRLGELEDAEELVQVMPFEPDLVAWMALLGACKTHGDSDRAGRIAEHVLRLQPDNSAACSLLSGTLANELED